MSEEKKINNLQQIINKRAENKLYADIAAINKVLQNNENILNKVEIIINTIKSPDIKYNRKLGDILYWPKELRKSVFEANIKEYIEKETKLFINEFQGTLAYVGDLQEQLSQIE